MTDLVQRALKVLESRQVEIKLPLPRVLPTLEELEYRYEHPIDLKLAALIRAAAEPERCPCRLQYLDTKTVHADDCALIQLCTAIAPGVEE